MAFLDILPNTKGMALVITKKHYPSYVFDIPEEVYNKLFLAARKVVKMLDKALNVKRTVMVMEGIGIDHAHIKLYPVHGMKTKNDNIISEERAFFKKYPGYTTTLLGPRADDKELAQLAKKIRESF